MRKSLSALFYFLGAFGLLASFMGLAKMLGPTGHAGDGGLLGLIGELLGLFFLPALFFGLGYHFGKAED